MKSASYAFWVSLLIICSGCCPWMKEFNEPERPTWIQGWREFRIGAVTSKGAFILNKGESVNDGSIGIKVIEIYAGKCRAFAEPEYPATKLQFFRVADQKVLCEDKFRVGGSRLDVIEGCGQSLKWGVIAISAINSKDNWVALDLR